ncbi:MAG: hypothetical protein OXR66_00910 [Candidatus Woesearchaeota archaeon]|nr:hypothetical protein [Candidatus Woesearchaeota archaeon]
MQGGRIDLEHADIERRAAIVAKIAPDQAARFQDGSESHIEDYRFDTDMLFLQHVLERAGVVLQENTGRSHEEELEFWDRRHLLDLAEHIETLTAPQGGRALEYLVKHSIRGDLPKVLSSGDTSDPYATYNTHVLKGFEAAGINNDVWMNHGGNDQYSLTWELEGGNSLELVQWKRDFRSEFAIGNISDCCIGINDLVQHMSFKGVLLDYFLDLAIQVAHINEVTSAGPQNKVGQAYFVGLTPAEAQFEGAMGRREIQELGRALLGVTSVEIHPRYENRVEYVPPIVEAIAREGGFRDEYGFDATFFSTKFSQLPEYLCRRKCGLREMDGTIREAASRLRQRKKSLKEQKAGLTEIKDRIRGTQSDLGRVGRLFGRMYSMRKLAVEKIGLLAAREDRLPYLGTNYMDLVQEFNDCGFFNNRYGDIKVAGFPIRQAALFSAVENVRAALKQKYDLSQPAIVLAK